jgi:hypothetical protein
MNLIVFVKHVPDTAEADLAVAADGKSIRAAGLPFQMNEWDRFALEEAVRLKEQTGGTLTAFLLGPEENEESLRRCLAVGRSGREGLGPRARDSRSSRRSSRADGGLGSDAFRPDPDRSPGLR